MYIMSAVVKTKNSLVGVINHYQLYPKPTAQSAIPGVSPERGY